jgi:hypothetical protein
MLLVLSLSACALPETGVQTGSIRPTIYVKGAVKEDILFVDSLKMGSAEQFNGNPKMLVIEEGVHIIEIRRNADVLYSEKIFISNGESRMVTFKSGER